jgi:hypothetical protein
MFTGRKKIVKPEGQLPDEFEEQVAQELFNLEVRDVQKRARRGCCSASDVLLIANPLAIGRL